MDPAYLDDSRKAALDVTPVAGAKVQAVVSDLVHTPPDIVTKAKLAMEPKNTVEKSTLERPK
jgi:hypothetical protein